MRAQTTEVKVELYVPNHCPPPIEAPSKIFKGERFTFGDIYVAWGASYHPVGDWITKMVIFHPEQRDLQFGFWDLANRKAIFCNQDHPGLYPAFLYIHGYEERGKVCRDKRAKEQAADYIVATCFPFHLGVFDPEREALGFSFAVFVELMKMVDRFDQELQENFSKALERLRSKRVSDLDQSIADRKKAIYQARGSEESFSSDTELIDMQKYRQEKWDRLTAGLALLE